MLQKHCPRAPGQCCGCVNWVGPSAHPVSISEKADPAASLNAQLFKGGL